jgi:general L-amino acid transport system permease protein
MERPAMSASFLRQSPVEAAPPPPLEAGWLAFVRKNLFGSFTSSLLTLGSLAVLALIVPPLWRFLIADAIWSAPDGEACRAPGAGACWAYIAAKTPFFIYGAYPAAERWRVNLTLLLGAALIFWLLTPAAKGKGAAALGFFGVFPILGFVLLHGAPALGLPVVGTNLWGGMMVSLLVALVGIVFALPGGILLALGRTSKLPALRMTCVAFIEFVRGVPLIAVLFMANTMLPLFLPPNWAPDRLLRPLVGVALFASAYMAEVVRAGLLSMSRGQYEGAQALGLSRVAMLRLVILPQALTLVIPGVVNNFIALFKDTTLVAIVGIFDFLRTVDTARLDPVWAGPTIAATGYIFAALFYLICCLAMSRYSQSLERRLAIGRRH